MSDAIDPRRLDERLLERAEKAEREVARLTRERDEAAADRDAADERGDVWSREYDRAEEARRRAVARADRAESQLALAMAWGAEACEDAEEWRNHAAGMSADVTHFAARADAAETRSATARDEGAAQMRAAAVAECREREAHARKCAAKYGPHSAAGAYEEDRAQAFEAAADAIEALPLRGPT